MFHSPFFARTPTPAQIAQFEQLPKAQQEQLAKQYGIPMSAISGGGGSAKAATNTVQPPRKTMPEAEQLSEVEIAKA